MTGLEFPNISPVMLSLGFFEIKWYSMAYLVGIVLTWLLAYKTVKKYDIAITKQNLEDVVFYATLGVVIGGRLGYVLFYGDGIFWQNPLQILAIWQGGMSFHGGAVGAVLGMYYAANKAKIGFLQLTDVISLYAPIGLFLGRIANFINDELWGRVSDVAWAVRFPNGGGLPRHPSQLYEAFLEGVVMFVVLNYLWRFEKIRKRTGYISGLFVLLYSVFRIFVECFRQPDVQLGYYWSIFTMGQMLSVPLIILGGYIMFFISSREK